MADFDEPASRLDAQRVIETIQLLSTRIEERFPDADLALTCKELLRVSQKAKQRAAWIQEPILTLRLGIILLIIGILSLLITNIFPLEISTRPLDIVLLVSLVEGGINSIVLLSAAIFFLVTIESRVKRRRALGAIHELRSLAHVVDMLQLTKDPDRLFFKNGRTKSSPVTGMGFLEMSRYLDYSCEMFSLIGKVAFIYGVYWRDDIALHDANDVERLTTGLSQKVFQKIIVLHDMASSVNVSA